MSSLTGTFPTATTAGPGRDLLSGIEMPPSSLQVRHGSRPRDRRRH